MKVSHAVCLIIVALMMTRAGLTADSSPARRVAPVDPSAYGRLVEQLPGVVISEFMADNKKTLRDEDGDSSDWIELFNSSNTAASLDGWFLTDDSKRLEKWRLPGLSIGPNEFLVVFASGKDRTNAATPLHTNFKLAAAGGYLALVSPRTNVVSEFGPTYPPQFADISYGRAAGVPQRFGYFVEPTPKAPNAEDRPGFAAAVEFSQSSRTFTAGFALTLSPGATNSVVHYTLDGTLPTNTSAVVSAPLAIGTSVQVRARAFEDGLWPGPPRTETFILLNADVAGFTSDLPVVILHSLGKGAPNTSRQTFAHISVFEPRGGVTSLTNPPTLVTRSGIKIRGSSTLGDAKSNFSVEFWNEVNEPQAQPFLGLPTESDWVLYAPDIFEPVLIHNPFIHQLSRDMGRYSSRTRFVEVYLNKGTGPITSAQYNGIYVLEEKIKIGPNRVAIDKLEPENVTPPSDTGGYLLKIDRLGPGESGLNAGGQAMVYVDPKEHDIRLPQRDAQEQYIKTYFNAFGSALNGANWLDPIRGYAAYIDVDSWIDYHVLEVLSGNVDAIVLSTYFHKPRAGKIVFGPHWDFDRALGSTDGRDANPRIWTTGPFFNGWWSKLFRDPDFWQKWIDRYQDLRTSLFSQTNLNALVDRLANEVRQAQPRERKRWGVPLRGGSYQSEVNLMKNWLSNRVNFIDKQLVPPPVLSAPGGRVTPGFILELSGPPNATVYYTADGSDPRSPQGGVSPRAQISNGSLAILGQSVRIVARARNLAQRQTGGPPVSSPWSGPVAATFTVGPPPLVLTELMFHPIPPGGGSVYTASDFEFIELKNVSGAPLNLVGHHFTSGVQFSFTSGSAITNLTPGQRVLVVKNRDAFQTRYPGVTNIAGEYTGSLGNGGNRLTLLGPLQEPIFDFTYQDSWQPLADGFGFSLTLRDEGVSPEDLGQPANWRLSAELGGSPGLADPPPPVLAPVVVNELMPNPGPGSHDQLELFNPTQESVDISGWFLSDDFRQPAKFRLPHGSILPARGYLWFKSITDTGAPFSFSKLGEQVYLFSADAAGNLTGWYHGFSFGPAEPGVSFGRYVNSVGQESFVAQVAPSFGQPNLGPRIGPIAINEIMFQPRAITLTNDSLAAYLELHNPSTQPVPLYDPERPTNSWHLRGDVDFDFPPGMTMPAHGYVVLVSFDPVSNPAALAQFRSRYGFASGSSIIGPWRGLLSPSAGTVRLLKPGTPELTGASNTLVVPEILVEEVDYSSAAPWPDGSSGTGLALLRRDPAAFANDPANWKAAPPSPGDADSDGDGLPDGWELSQGLDPASAVGENGAGGDPDQDGLTNLQELLIGTAPKDAGSTLKLEAAYQAGGGLLLSFRVTAEHSYTLQYCDDLRLAAWQTLQTLVAAPGQSTLSIADKKGNTRRFYRLSVP